MCELKWIRLYRKCLQNNNKARSCHSAFIRFFVTCSAFWHFSDTWVFADKRWQKSVDTRWSNLPPCNTVHHARGRHNAPLSFCERCQCHLSSTETLALLSDEAAFEEGPGCTNDVISEMLCLLPFCKDSWQLQWDTAGRLTIRMDDTLTRQRHPSMASLTLSAPAGSCQPYIGYITCATHLQTWDLLHVAIVLIPVLLYNSGCNFTILQGQLDFSIEILLIHLASLQRKAFSK